MLTKKPQVIQQQSLTRKGCAELTASFLDKDRYRYRQGAALTVELHNRGDLAFKVLGVNVAWRDNAGAPQSLQLPWAGKLAPRGTWTLLDPRSYLLLRGFARQGDRHEFGRGKVVHDVTVRLDDGGPVFLPFQVCWGFATPAREFGFFLPALA
ncbi:hypothetical protein [Deinococcus sp. Leaf326]|uniref:hypothetical protein n=1 Tax=Deinococcus sp. Leaf326 TaxID=1736338 RepID=UPI0006FEC4E5|nr:hypothetical protein [Deinococcus sp. Leaf326]KQR15468.1 hypothetical protein ASF71_20460 [Deinococcus sp. Leaf326]